MQFIFDFEKFYLPVTYDTYKNTETIVEIPTIIANSFLENTPALKLMSHLQELST